MYRNRGRVFAVALMAMVGVAGYSAVDAPEAQAKYSWGRNGNGEGNVAAAKAPKPAIDVGRLRSQLPPIYSLAPAAKAYTDVAKWDDLQRSMDLDSSKRGVIRATERLQYAQRLQAQAQNIINGAVPHEPRKGESKDEFKLRVAKVKELTDPLIEPYNKFLDDCQIAINNSNEVARACQASNREGDSWVPAYARKLQELDYIPDP